MCQLQSSIVYLLPSALCCCLQFVRCLLFPVPTLNLYLLPIALWCCLQFVCCLVLPIPTLNLYLLPIASLYALLIAACCILQFVHLLPNAAMDECVYLRRCKTLTRRSQRPSSALREPPSCQGHPMTQSSPLRQ